MKIRMIEATHLRNRGSIGCHYVVEAARRAGFSVDWELRQEYHHHEYDVELISLHHCLDFLQLRDLPRRGKIRLVGGHVMANNPRPAIPFADVICIGEGEEWIVMALKRIREGAKARDLVSLPGTIVPSAWDGGIPSPNAVTPLPRHRPYLNRCGEGHARVWYIEMARGCPFACRFCELGWSVKYRKQERKWLFTCLDLIDTSRSKRVSFFAPDEASHPDYPDLLEEIHRRGLITSFGSMRLDRVMKSNLPFRKNMLIRVGLDGLTEATRKRVGKPLSDVTVVEYFRMMSTRGHSNFKVFVIFGYPWEELEDFDEWERLWGHITSIPRKQSAHVRVKFTPFIPQPSTPLGRETAKYDERMVARIRRWLDRVREPHRYPGWYIESDGVMSKQAHEIQCRLTQGDENIVFDLEKEGIRCSSLSR